VRAGGSVAQGTGPGPTRLAAGQLTVERPLAALYETIGQCGRPPQDNARLVALYAILLTIVAGLVIPAGVVYGATRL